MANEDENVDVVDDVAVVDDPPVESTPAVEPAPATEPQVNEFERIAKAYGISDPSLADKWLNYAYRKSVEEQQRAGNPAPRASEPEPDEDEPVTRKDVKAARQQTLADVDAIIRDREIKSMLNGNPITKNDPEVWDDAYTLVNKRIMQAPGKNVESVFNEVLRAMGKAGQRVIQKPSETTKAPAQSRPPVPRSEPARPTDKIDDPFDIDSQEREIEQYVRESRARASRAR
jgi:hypothetical protein